MEDVQNKVRQGCGGRQRLNLQGNAVHMVGMGGRFFLFLLEVAKGVQELHKRFTKAVANRDLANVCSDTHRREVSTDNQERSKEDEQGSEVSLH